MPEKSEKKGEKGADKTKTQLQKTMQENERQEKKELSVSVPREKGTRESAQDQAKGQGIEKQGQKSPKKTDPHSLCRDVWTPEQSIAKKL